ncbi:hypothetical protein EI94DRAFT_1806201 [Lactarius quietus]|nr:hypothetical protein EI94DRAFT_1806201 [Lactarius quietus]
MALRVAKPNWLYALLFFAHHLCFTSFPSLLLHNLGSQTPSDYNSHSTPLWSPFDCNDNYPNSVANNSTLMPSQAKIQRISEQDLIIAQNPTFMRIYAENVTLKIRADSIEKAYDELVASHGTMPHVQTEELQEPTPKEPEGYPDIDYWYKCDQLDEWKRREEFKSNNRATVDSRRGPKPETDDNVAFWHFQHKDGTVLDGEEIRKIWKEAKIQWKLLSDKYGDIGSLWTTDEDKFPLLRLCNDHYKALTITYADYSHWYLKWVKSKVKCKCPCKCGARSKTKSKSKGKSKSPSKFKYKYTSPPKSKYKYKYKYKSEDEEEDEDEDKTESKSQCWEGTTCRVSKMQEESEDDDMEDDEGQDDREEDEEDEEDNNNNNNNNNKVVYASQTQVCPFSREAKATHHASCCKQQGEVNATQGTVCPDTTNFNPNPLANIIRTTPPASAPENMDTREDEGPNRQRDSGSNNSNAPPMALPSKAPTPAPDAGAPDARTSMAPPSKAPTPAPDAGTPDARTSMAPPSKAPTPVPIRGTSESRRPSAAPSNNAPMPGPSGSISDSRHASVAPPSNAPTPGPSGSVLESGSGTNSNTSREGKAKAKKPVPMRLGKAKTAREEFAKVWVNLDEATKEIYKQRETDAKSTAESSSA